MKRSLCWLILAVAWEALAVAAPPSTPPEETRVTLGGVLVVQFRAASGGFSPVRRAATMENRIVEILSRPDLTPDAVRVTPGKGGRSATITVGPILLVTVTEADAQANRSTPMKLATTWAESFRRGYAEARPEPARGP